MSEMRLCSTCNAIDIRAILEQSLPWIDSAVPKERTYRIHDTVAIMEKHKDVCDFCALLWKAWEGERTIGFGKEFEPPSLSLCFGKDLITHGSGAPVRVVLESGERVTWFLLEIFPHKTFDFGRVPHDPVLDCLYREISSNSNTDEALNLVCQWYKECLHNHPSCRRASELNFALPTRLIEVGDDTNNPRLYVPSSSGSKPTNGAWVSLSYCWGGNSTFILTKDSLPLLLAGIPLNEFPKTLKDAIVITRALGVKYLWIDALCIRQDSLQDWEQESPKMSEIYANAVLTIIAATTPSVKMGIFQRRELLDSCQLPWRQPRPGSASEDKQTSIGVRMTSPNIYRSGKVIHWAKRAWTFQECLLSWRTLHYYPEQIVWSCIECTTLESGFRFEEEGEDVSTGSTIDHRQFQLFRKELASTRSEPPQKKIPGAGRDSEKYRRWYKILEKYSDRQLTRELDRLPAIGGLALSITEDMQDTYHAGLWEGDLIYGLAWKLNCYDDADASRQRTKGVLSWNWTSSGISISFPFENHLTNYYTKIACVEEIDIEYNSSAYGEVKSGRLVLSGPCYRIGLVNQTWEATSGQTKPAKQLPAFNRFLNAKASTDLEIRTRIADNDRVEGREYIILSLLSGTWYGVTRGFLWLECSHSPGSLGGKRYCRVGMLVLRAYSDGSELLIKELEENPWPRETVMIV